MKWFKNLFLLIVVMNIVACSSNDINITNVVEIQVTEFDTFGSVNHEDPVVFTDEETVETFMEAIHSAKKEEGVVDMDFGDFDLNVISSDGKEEGFHLWLREDMERGSIMRVENTHVVYTLSKKSTQELKDILFDLS
ncbi:hypothetical protein ACFSTA_00930 [Ornithinibacillus salinisoli]|uniref:YhfM-like domain-containing protein n=1 Tax=Ornithinibacillus salinisoli TaxID=1848459 RepID=A0ABW4VX43_9BACI